MFTVAERDRVQERLLELAEADPEVVAAAITGSRASGRDDEWSDIDLAFAIAGDLAPALARWTGILDGDFAALHHWDLPFGASMYRVFLLQGGLEVDVAFTPVADFGARGPDWRTVFGESVDREPTPPPRRDDLIGIAWHHVLHARACLERGKPWQAEWLISGVRDQVIALACVRLGLAARFAKGADLLPPEVTTPLEATLVGSLDGAELRRALRAVVDALIAELERTEPALVARLAPTLAELAGPGIPRPRLAPAGWHAVTPRLVVEDAKGLVEFVRQVFGAAGEYLRSRPSELAIGDSVIKISDAGARRPATAFLYVYVADADATYRRALEAGARSIEAPAEMPYGDRRSTVEDRWGNTWQIASRARPSRAGSA